MNQPYSEIETETISESEMADKVDKDQKRSENTEVADKVDKGQKRSESTGDREREVERTVLNGLSEAE